VAAKGSGPRPGDGDDPAGGRPVRCLVVDDDPGRRAQVLRELRVPFPALTAHEAGSAAAFDRALDEAIDLVVTEYRLGWTDGLRVLHAVRARWPHVAVVIFTDAGSQELAVDAMKAGADDWVVKSPLHLVRLRAAAVRALAESRQRIALAGAEGRYRRLVERVPVALYQLAPDGRILDANPAMGRLVGRPHDALVGTSKWALYRRASESARWQVVMARHDAVGDFETEWVRADGRVVPVRETARALRGPDGSVHFDCAAQEVRGRGLAADRLADVRHELADRLHAVVGMTQLALERPLDDEARGFVEAAERAARAMRTAVDALHREAERATTPVASFDLRTAVNEALRSLGPQAARRGVELVCHVRDETLARVVGDARRFRAILAQLVGRAIRSADAGHVVVTVAADDVGLRLEVETAAGAPAAVPRPASASGKGARRLAVALPIDP